MFDYRAIISTAL